MSISALTRQPFASQLLNMRQQMEELQRQLGTGRKSETYGGLGTAAHQSVTFRGRIADVEAYSATIQTVNLRIRLMDSAMNRLSTLPADARSALDPNAYEVRSDGRTDAQKAARLSLDEFVGLLNTEADGRFLFSGKTPGTKPVVAMTRILDGDGARAGLKQVIQERLEADYGVYSLPATPPQGRLTVGTAGATTTIARQEVAPNEFGFQIEEVETTNPGAITITPTGAPISSVDVAFTSQPSPGDKITLDVGLPDGTRTSMTLTATMASPPDTGYFTIGASTAATAASFETMLEQSIQRKAVTELRSASAMRASEMFFDTTGNQLPSRVLPIGGNPQTAVSVDNTSTTALNTVYWYEGYDADVTSGDPSTYPRSDAMARIDTSLEISYGARANEEGFRITIQALAVAAVETYSEDVDTDEDRYAAMIDRVRNLLNFDGTQSTADIHAEVALASRIATETADRHRINKGAMQSMLEGVEGIDSEEAALQLLTLKTRMDASYRTTAILGNLSLVNFL